MPHSATSRGTPHANVLSLSTKLSQLNVTGHLHYFQPWHPSARVLRTSGNLLALRTSLKYIRTWEVLSKRYGILTSKQASDWLESIRFNIKIEVSEGKFFSS